MLLPDVPWADAFLWSCAALLLAELLGVLPVAVVGRQLRVYASLWRSFGGGGRPDQDSFGGGGRPDQGIQGTGGRSDQYTVLCNFSFWSRVWISDVDLWRHLNNCRYYQRCEEGRFHFLFRSGLGAFMHKRKYVAGLAGCLLRFRRELRPLQAFRVQTRLIGWDDRSFFLEHKFFATDGFVHAHGLSTYKLVKATCARGVTPARILRELAVDGSGGVAADAIVLVFPDERVVEEKGVAGLKAVDEWSSACLGAKKKK
jgi:acyl-CoA thioesterase FadM